MLLISNWRVAAGWWMALFVIAGFFHGYAYGESIYGAEPMPLVAYLAGVIVQTVLVGGIALATRAVWAVSAMAPRLEGAAIGGIGFAAIVAQIIPAP
jgi:urease accessory protein